MNTFSGNTLNTLTFTCLRNLCRYCTDETAQSELTMNNSEDIMNQQLSKLEKQLL